VEPSIDEKDLLAIIESLLQSSRTNWFGFGERCIGFERAFAKYLGMKHAVFVNSGSSANLLSIAALVASGRIKKGSKVVTTACTFPTTLNPVLFYGLKPIFVDLELPSWSVDVEAIREAVESGAQLLLLPHLNGIPHEMDEICAIARTNSLLLLEDACDALGSRFESKPVGTFGELGTFSFYVAHHMTTGEGGMIVTNDGRLAEILSSLRDWGRATKASFTEVSDKRTLEYQNVTEDLPEDYESRYTYTNIGFNLKPLELQGALGLSQLEKLESLIQRRKMNFDRMYASLKDYADFLILPEPTPKADVSWFWFPIVVRQSAPFKRKDLVRFLEKANIETRPLLAGNILKQPAYRELKYEVVGRLTYTETILQGGFIVGVHPKLADADIDYVIDTFRSFFEGLSR
jgi:CDP-6-deoxy-D-xylo-4-hexulose-3-dehydrase